MIGKVGREVGVVDHHSGRLSIPIDGGPLAGDKTDQFIQVGDVRDVAERNGLAGKERRAKDGQNGVLVTGRGDGAGEGVASLDDKIGHRTGAWERESCWARLSLRKTVI